MNFEQARQNMVKQQVRPWAVLDPRILATLNALPRENFVPAEFRQLAYADIEIPIGHGQSMMKPVVEGRLLQALAIQGTETVLEVGTGSGYLTACMAKLARSVLSLDYHADFVKAAEERLSALKLDNVHLETADIYHGFESAGRFDVIVFTGSMRELPERFLRWLESDGRAFAVVGQSPIMEARVFTRTGEGQFAGKSVFDTVVSPLHGATPSQAFEF